MSVFKPHSVTCGCGSVFEVYLADGINAGRSPKTRQAILDGTVHRASCPKCGRRMTVEKPFLYTDLTRNTFIRVLPRRERHTWKKASAALNRAMTLVPGRFAENDDRRLRVVFGMDELREKLVAQDARMDDRFVELLKVLVVYEHPFLMKRPRLRLTLDKVASEAAEFVASYDHHPSQFRISMPRWVVDALMIRSDDMERWARTAHPRGSIYELPDHWVSMRRWSPEPTALERLRSYAEEIQGGHDVDTESVAFKGMLTALPRGSQLPSWAKQDLRVLFEYAKKKDLQTLEDALFEIRFGIELEDDWGKNSDLEDIDTLWQLLKDLPDTNVEGNSSIHEILLDVGEGGGVYSPTTHDIRIGSDELGQLEDFQDVMRHEVGHAVHEDRDPLVSPWLETRFGWRVFGVADSDIDAWVDLMGGWGTLSSLQRGQVRGYLRTVLGPGDSWNPGPTPNVPANHPWNADGFGPRLACEKTPGSWYRYFNTWHRSNGQAFFLNYYYQAFMAVDAATLDLVAQMPSSYASMSQFEFFAELYALYFDLDDPKRPSIPTDVSDWLAQNIGAPEPDAPRPRAAATKPEWATKDRPRGPAGPSAPGV